MRKEVYLFLEYKFRDFTDEELSLPHATGVIAAFEKLSESRISQIKKLGLKFCVSLTSLPGNICPASPEAQVFLISKVKRAANLNPEVIWLDHLRFEGHWEILGEVTSGLHDGCRFCKGKNREVIIQKLAIEVRKKILQDIKLGYFAVPRRDIGLLGQNHKELVSVFDYISPMLYHRMIGKPVSYIGEYIKYLSGLGIKAKILPIIQLKDMPDDLEDKLTTSEIQEEVSQSLTNPSIGVAIFSWDQAIEKDKLESVSKILRKIK